MKALFTLVVLSLSVTSVWSQELLPQQTIHQTEKAGSVSNRNAVEKITAYNIIEPGAFAHYTAGQAVTLQPGFSARAGSIFKASIGSVSGKYTTARPEIRLCARAYPNPFQQSTIIEYTVPQAGQVSFSLVDEQGHILQQETSSREAGRQKLDLMGTNLTPGIYFYQIRLHNEQQTIRLLKTL